MKAISVVIITRNEESNIVDCINSAKFLTDDVVIVDGGSNDNTVQLAKNAGANVFIIDWQGFGFSRNFGAAKAKYNWILALDADERMSPQLAIAIQQKNLSKEKIIFKFGRTNFLGKEKISFGTLGFERVTRIYHRNYCKWDLSLVHEKLISQNTISIKTIPGYITHYGLKSYEDYKNKAVLYAQLSAEKYFLEGRKAGLLKRFFSPLFNSLKSYIFQLGFLDGKRGFVIAKTIAQYSWLKYYYLNQLHATANNKEPSFSTARKIETVSN